MTKVLREATSKLGRGRIHSLHLNDSQTPLGSNRDRHANIGEGELGESGCAAFLSEPRFEDLPCVLETGSGDGSITASVPFAEFNYGAMPNVQVSLALPIEDDTGTFQHYGYGVTEFGIKTRFVQESADRPQISFYPSIQIPSTPGHIVTFLPLWLQKSWGPWTAFGGGGVYLNPGAGERNYAFVGGTLERSISPATTIGAELYHQGADSTRAGDMTAANVGVTSQIGEYHAILFSFGRGLHGSNTFSGYASYEFQLGPAKPK